MTDVISTSEELETLCTGCGRFIEEGHVISFGSGIWHLECFKCSKCSSLIEHDSNILLLANGMPICESCSYCCAVCKLPIQDEAIMTGNMAYHEACFKCYLCGKLIDDLVYTKTEHGLACTSCAKVEQQSRQSTVQQTSLPKKDLPQPPVLAKDLPEIPSTVVKQETRSPGADLSLKSESLVRDLQLARERQSEAEISLEKIKNASKCALEEFKLVKIQLQQECLHREHAEDVVQKYKKQLALIEKDNKWLLGENESLKGLVDSLQLRLSAVESKSNQAKILEDHVAELETQIQSLVAQKDEFGQSHKLTEALDVQQKLLNSQISATELELEDLLTRKNIMTSEVAALEVKKTQLEATLLGDKKKESKSDLDGMHASEVQLSRKVSQLESLKGINASIRKKAQFSGGSLSSIFDKGSRANLSSGPVSPLVENGSSVSPTSLKESMDGSLNSLPPTPRNALQSEAKVAHRVSLTKKDGTAQLFKWTGSHDKTVLDKLKKHQFQAQPFLVPMKCGYCGDKIWQVKAKEMQCKDCPFSAHAKCAPLITSACSPNGGTKSILFGNDLYKQCEIEGRTVPLVVQKCVEAIEARGLDQEGIYRKSGLVTQMKSLIELCNSSRSFSNDVDFMDEEKWPDVHTFSGALKQYFRSLPSPLTTYELYSVLVQGAAERDHSAQLKAFVLAISSLPVPNYETLKYLTSHLHKVSSFSEVNKMHAKNLAVVFGPNVIRSPVSAHASEGEVNAEHELSDMAYKNAVFEFLILNFKTVFEYADMLRAGRDPPIFKLSDEELLACGTTELRIDHVAAEESTVEFDDDRQPTLNLISSVDRSPDDEQVTFTDNTNRD